MNNETRITNIPKFLMLLVLIMVGGVAFSQKLKGEEKIAPFFKSLITAQKLAKSKEKQKCRWFSKPKENKTFHDSGDLKYECIIYTTEAASLRKKGIVINSVLPSFVTATATLKQIEQLASMSEVTYIADPSKNHLHNFN